jgi:DNA polymerase
VRRHTFRKIAKDLKGYLEFERATGMNDIYLEESSSMRKKEGKESLLESLKKEGLGCSECSLSQSRRTVVFSSGSPRAQLVFVGEAPGYEEDVQGLPFVGRAGQLLTKIIEAMGYKRKDVYICNVLKCRPPQNRNPLPSEIFTCQAHLARQLDIIKPKVVCALGKFAAQTLLKTETPISLLRGKFHDYHGIKLIPTFHPAYLLRNPKETSPV